MLEPGGFAFFFLEMEYAPTGSFCSLWSKKKKKNSSAASEGKGAGHGRRQFPPSQGGPGSWGKFWTALLCPRRELPHAWAPGVFARRLDPASQGLRSLRRFVIVSPRVRRGLMALAILPDSC